MEELEVAYCSKCGKELEDESLTICPECKEQEAKEVVLPQEETKNKKMSGTGLASLILGILGIVLNIIMALFGHVLCIIGICLGVNEKKKTGNKVGFIVSIIGEVLAVINSIAGVILQMI